MSEQESGKRTQESGGFLFGPHIAQRAGEGDITMVVRFKETVRVRVWGRELSNFHKGEVHSVPTAIAGVLLAQGCVEPVADETARELRHAS